MPREAFKFPNPHITKIGNQVKYNQNYKIVENCIS